MPPEFQPKAILEELTARGVDFVVIGGLAGIAHGSTLPSFDVDVVYATDRENLERLAATLRELHATLRGAPPDLPFQLDADTFEQGAIFTFDTRYGAFDVLSDPVGAPPYPTLKAAATEMRIEGVAVAVASLDHLIAMKEATGRVKDRLAAAEYRTLSDELRAPKRT